MKKQLTFDEKEKIRIGKLNEKWLKRDVRKIEEERKKLNRTIENFKVTPGIYA